MTINNRPYDDFDNPDFAWYSSISKKNGITPRCSFSSIQRCPRYYQSLSVLGMIGRNTKISPSLDKKLQNKWEKTDFWPHVAEQVTSAGGPYDGIKSYTHFCPEVSYDNFGYFAESLHEYRDKIDRYRVIKKMRSTNADQNDWHWNFKFLTPMHYTECYLFSLLQTYQEQHEEIFEIKPNFYGIGINLKALFRRVFKKNKII